MASWQHSIRDSLAIGDYAVIAYGARYEPFYCTASCAYVAASRGSRQRTRVDSRLLARMIGTAASAGRYHHFVPHVRNYSDITHAVASGATYEARARENGDVITERT